MLRWAILLGMLLVALAGAIILWPRAGPPAGPSPSVATAPRPDALRTAGDSVLDAFIRQDAAALAALAAPAGVRFSPSAFIDPQTDLLLRPEDLASLFTASAPRRWGYAEGSGDPIVLTGAAYVADHVPAAAARAAHKVTLDGSAWQSNTVNNIAEAYPGARSIEYLIEPAGSAPDAPYARQALRLVFREAGDRLLLVGVVHDAWSP